MNNVDAPTTIRLPDSLKERADKLIDPLMEADEAGPNHFNSMKRSDVIRMAVAIGIQEMERRHDAPGGDSDVRYLHALGKAFLALDPHADTDPQFRALITPSQWLNHDVYKRQNWEVNRGMALETSISDALWRMCDVNSEEVRD